MLFVGHDKILPPGSHLVTIQLNDSTSEPSEPPCFAHKALNALQGAIHHTK